MLFKVHSFSDFLWMMLWNVLVIALLHAILLYCCVKLSPEAMNYERPRFAPKKWENNGKFYRDKLKINAWKDYMPQYVGKDGFSKESLEKDVTLPYLEEFLTETCRGEWYHATCLWGLPFLLFANPPLYGISFSLILTVIHGACVVIQRYNRFRLLILRKKLLRDARRSQQSATAVVVPVAAGTTEKSAS
ncbi:MAG: hypothetical protein PUC32_01960 [Oscillospiraceae bacterium]|nr:hypothetical protein [Oscillospiraceae bacterium]